MAVRNFHVRFIVSAGVLIAAVPAFGLPETSLVSCRDAFAKSSTEERPQRRRELPGSFKLTVWRYNTGILDAEGKSSFDNANVTRLKYDPESQSFYARGSEFVRQNELVEAPESRRRRLDGGIRSYVPNIVLEEMESGSRGRGIFEKNQAFTFNIYENLGYLSRKDSKLQKQIARRYLQPEQVTVTEATEETTAKELKAKYGKIPPHARLESESSGWDRYQSYYAGYKRPRNRIYEEKVAASWVIAGQVDGKKLPLALEAYDLQIPIDRNQYPYTFEIGRAGQEKNYAFEETLRSSVFHAATEVLASGGRIEDAYVFAHAMDEARAIVFKRKYKLTEFSRYIDPARSQELVLMAPLTRFLEAFDLSEFSAELQEVRQAFSSVQSLSSLELHQRLLKNRMLLSHHLKEVGAGDTPILFQTRDFSWLRYGLTYRSKEISSVPAEQRSDLAARLSSSRPFLEERDNLAVILERTRYDQPGLSMARIEGIHRPHPMYQTEGLQNLNEFLAQERAIEIFSDTHDRALSQAEAERMLLGTYLYYVRILRREGIRSPRDFMRSLRIRFAFTARLAEFQQPIANEQAKGYWFVQRMGMVLQEGFGFSSFQRRIPTIRMESWSYDVDQLEALRARLKIRPTVHPDESQNHFLKDARLLAPTI